MDDQAKTRAQLVEEIRELRQRLATLEARSDDPAPTPLDSPTSGEALFLQFLETLPVAVFILQHDGKPFYANRLAQEILGKGIVPEATTSHLAETYRAYLLGTDTPYPVDRMPIVQALQGEFATASDMEVHTPERNIPLEIWASPIFDQTGAVTHAVAVFQDVTERRITEQRRLHLESQLRQAQKLDAIGTLAGGIAHEFNNILQGIIGFAQLAVPKLSQDSPAHHHLGWILNLGYRAKDLVRQILTFSRNEKQEYRPILLAPILKESLKMMRATLPSTVEIHQRIQATDVVVVGDPTQIQQVMVNLCTNAGQAMRDEGGVLEVELREEYLDAKQAAALSLRPGEHVKLTVRDTGRGMERKLQERIFEPFFTTKPVGQGTGLGLSIVHGIVESCGGRIAVRSELGKGTAFEILLPRTELMDPASPRSEEPLRHGAGRVLFVDDEIVLVEMAKEMIEYLGYQAVVTTDPLEALKIFQARPHDFDVVITDQTMPKMTGAQLGQELLAIRPDLSIVIVTGFSEALNEDRAEALGFHRYMEKPLSLEGLSQILGHALDSGSQPENDT